MLTKKIGIISSLVVVGILLGAPLNVAATTYEDAQNAESPVDVEIVAPDPGEIEIPIPPGPEEPDVMPPLEPTNPDLGDGLSLHYISGLQFPTTEFSLDEDKTVTANLDSGELDGEKISFPNMAVVIDIRGDRTSGWDLQVSQKTELFEGAILTMNPKSSDIGDVSTSSDSLILNDDAQIFASADGTGAAGVNSISMGKVTLFVPKGTGLGEYKTTLSWSLVSEPRI